MDTHGSYLPILMICFNNFFKNQFLKKKSISFVFHIKKNEKSISQFQGWQRKLDPEYNVMQTLQALLFKADWAQSLSYTIEGLMAP